MIGLLPLASIKRFWLGVPHPNKFNREKSTRPRQHKIKLTHWVGFSFGTFHLFPTRQKNRATRSELLGLTYSRCIQSLLVSTNDFCNRPNSMWCFVPASTTSTHKPSLNNLRVNHCTVEQMILPRVCLTANSTVWVYLLRVFSLVWDTVVVSVAK